MKTIYYTLMVVCLVMLGVSCTKNNFIDTGVSKGRFDGNMMEYMEAHAYDWDSTLVMIRHAGAGMVQLFEGKDVDHPEITFFGLTNHSIRRYLLEKSIKKVTDLDPGWCRSILLQHVVDGRYYRKDIPAGESSSFGTVGSGGVTLTTLGGTQVWTYVVVEEKDGVVQHVAKPIFVKFLKSNKNCGVASGDIEPDNGLIHALEYKFTLGEEEKL